MTRHDLTPIELAVLEALGGNLDWCYTFDGIIMAAETADGALLTRTEVRDACRSLKAKGLAHFQSGLVSEDDGSFVGSGYGATKAGAVLLTAMDDEREALR